LRVSHRADDVRILADEIEERLEPTFPEIARREMRDFLVSGTVRQLTEIVTPRRGGRDHRRLALLSRKIQHGVDSGEIARGWHSVRQADPVHDITAGIPRFDRAAAALGSAVPHQRDFGDLLRFQPLLEFEPRLFVLFRIAALLHVVEFIADAQEDRALDRCQLIEKPIDLFVQCTASGVGVGRITLGISGV
jgi:hypothetical protein